MVPMSAPSPYCIVWSEQSGSFVHLTSTSDLIGNFSLANYRAVKMDIVGLSRATALNLERFIVRSDWMPPSPSHAWLTPSLLVRLKDSNA